MESADGSDKSVTGLQNTARVAIARYGSEWDVSKETWTGVSEVTITDQATILEETGAKDNKAGVYISDVAIWEPNSNTHVQYIVDNNNKIKWSATDAAKYDIVELVNNPNKTKGFGLDTQMPTYALAKAAKDVNEIANLYRWDGKNDDEKETANTTLKKQVVLQTERTSATDYTVKDGVENLISTSSTDASVVNFTIAPNSIIRLRVYLWLEGQDVDCINYASHGGGITLNLGLVKGSKPNSHEPEEDPAGGSES